MIDLLMLANSNGTHNHIYALGRSYEKMKKRFEVYVENEYFHIIEQNICNAFLDEYRFDYIVHGASNADPVTYAKYPVETMLTNIQGGIKILEYGRKNHDCKITILSTFEVYGNTGNDKYKETDVGLLDFNMLRSCYPESKRSIELLSSCYAEEYGINTNIARLCSIYGPTMQADDSKAHAEFLKNAINNKNIILKSNGIQRRTYCYVIDAVTGILTVLFQGKGNEKYNISNENAIASIADIAKTIASIAGLKVIFDLPSKIETKRYLKPQDCILDNLKLRNLGWIGKYNIIDGFTECYNILKTNKTEDII